MTTAPPATAETNLKTSSPLMGETPAIVAIRRTIEQVAGTNLTVLLQGESGTGKEVVARQLGWRGGALPFVKINCAAIPNELWESELFGYEPGAFTGANRQKSGKFELAGGGTIFLDEISEMPLNLQAKLLQVLQDGEFSRLGGHRSMSVDVRVIAATNVDLPAAVNAGHFRRDLFYRLNVIAILLPPLRQRSADLPLLIEHFLNHYASLYERQPAPFSAGLQRRMMNYAWPGNVRELENLIKRYVILGNEDAILGDLLAGEVAETESGPMSSPPPVAPNPPAAGGDRTENERGAEGEGVASRNGSKRARNEAEPGSLIEVGRRAAWAAERRLILQVLDATHWNRRLAARQLQISYKSLQNKLKLLLQEGAGAER